jgi:membrane fusion protein, multidrug efflux system
LRTTYVSAIVIAVVAVLWLVSGELREPKPAGPKTLAEQNARLDAEREDRPLTHVRARIVRAEPQTERVTLRGWTANKRTVEVKSETSGRVLERPVEKGARVKEGQLLCRIAMDDREAQITEANEAVNQARIEYEGAMRLKDRGLVSETIVATSKARLAAAQAQLARSQLEAEHTIVRAPFAGLVENTHVEVGAFVQPGTPCATIIDLDPMLLVGRISERDVHAVQLGGSAEGVLLSGEHVTGTVTFVGKQSDSATRTYPVEVQVPNPDYALRSGITTEILVPIGTHLAHRVSPSLLALDDEGRIGLRTVDADNAVQFHRVEVIADDAGSVWVSGLPEVATLITVGQELVVPGEHVDVTFEATGELPAAAPTKGTASTPENLAGDGAKSSRAPQTKLEVGTG